MFDFPPSGLLRICEESLGPIKNEGIATEDLIPKVFFGHMGPFLNYEPSNILS